jgi:ribose-phosphate pyrophosphokinase
LLNRSVDCVVSVEPHFHQHSFSKKIFSVPFHRLECSALLREYVRKHFSKGEVVGVGERAGKLAKHVDSGAAIFEKFKIGHDYRGKEVVVVDDLVSTGGSVLKTLGSLNSDKVQVLVVHGLFLGDSYRTLSKKVKNIVSVNTIRHESNGIDVSGLIAGKLMEL